MLRERMWLLSKKYLITIVLIPIMRSIFGIFLLISQFILFYHKFVLSKLGDGYRDFCYFPFEIEICEL